METYELPIPADTFSDFNFFIYKPVTNTIFNTTTIANTPNVSPVKTYDAATQKNQIMADNRGLTGIYR